MANLSKVIYINEEDYSTLLNGGTITKGGVTYSHDPTALYVIKNVSAPEYAETAGYATTAGQATKATQDGDGNVIKDTYEKEQQVVIEFDGDDTTFPNLTDSEVRALCNDNSKTVILKDTSLRSQSTEGFPLFYRTEFTTDHWAFSSTYVEAAGAGWLIRLCWDQNHEAIVREFSDTKLYPSENTDLGQAYGISSNNANLAARTSSISEFELKKGGIVAIKFTTDIDITNPSLNINSTGSKPIYYRGSALSGGTVNAGDTVTFIYDGTVYHIISIDTPAATATPLMDGTAAVGTSTKYAREDHRHPTDTTRQVKLVDSVTQQTGETVNFKTVNSQSLLGSGNINTNQVVLGVYSSGSFVESTLNQNNEWIGVGAVTPVKDKIYFDVSSAVSYAWTGTAYVPSSDLLVVNITAEYNNNPITYSADRTFNEIYSTWQNEKDVICFFEHYAFQLYYIDAHEVNFSSLISDIGTYSTIHITSNNIISISMESIPQLANNLTTTETGLALDATQGRTLKNMITTQQVRVGSVAGKLYRNNVGGSGNFSISGNSGCIPDLTAGTFLVSIYAKSTTQSYTFRFNFGSSVTYDLSTTNGEISDVRQITIPSSGTFSGSVLNSSVASGTILYVVMYNYLTPVSTVGVAAVTNQYSDLDGTPTITPVNNGTLTIQQNEITVGTFTANQSSNTTANIYSTMFGTLGQSGFERDNYNSIGGWAGVETVTPNPLVTYVDILSNKLYRYDPLTSRYIELSEGDLSTITSTAITDLTDIL